MIQSAIEQAKLKFNIHSKSTQDNLLTDGGIKTKDADFLSDSVTESLAEMSELEETLATEKITTKTATATSSQRLGRKYGLQPKFVKMRELHLLMFYLIYGYRFKNYTTLCSFSKISSKRIILNVLFIPL